LKTYIAKTFLGLENILADELSTLGAQNLEILNRAVKFQGDKTLLYKSNIYLRTALKILVPLKTFPARNENMLYSGVYGFPWEDIFNYNQTFVIDSVVNSSFFKHSRYAALKVKDAIVDRFRNKYPKRPSIDKTDPDFRINIHISNDQCTLSLDSSGSSLHKRGYKVENVMAPLNEVLAAGLISLSGWKGETAFIDPMCGSGTLPIEAALLSYNIPPGIFRNKFGLEKWHDFDPSLLNAIRTQSVQITKSKTPVIYGCDIAEQAIDISRKNSDKPGLKGKIEFFVQSFFNYTPPPDHHGTVIINPPYDYKIKEKDICAFYEHMGNVLKKNYAGYEVWILSHHKKALKNIGLHASNKITLFNGPLECKFQKYSMYKGSKSRITKP
jgi:putative N6-adenine-specific DNA methylase